MRAGRRTRRSARAALMRGELLIPIVKGWCTEQATQMASLAMQVHGGMGFIEETGVAQTLRDARIASIYEGTTGNPGKRSAGPQAGARSGRGDGAAAQGDVAQLNDMPGGDGDTGTIRDATIEAITALRAATETLLQQAAQDAPRAFAVSVPYLMLCGRVLGGALLARSAAIASTALSRGGGAQEKFYRAKLQTARFYAEHLLPEALGLMRVIESGGVSVSQADPELI